MLRVEAYGRHRTNEAYPLSSRFASHSRNPLGYPVLYKHSPKEIHYLGPLSGLVLIVPALTEPQSLWQTDR